MDRTKASIPAVMAIKKITRCVGFLIVSFSSASGFSLSEAMALVESGWRSERSLVGCAMRGVVSITSAVSMSTRS